nr:hypothetical protein [Tanacetum cinerariifolium]
MYHKKNVDFVYLLWEYFVYQVEHKDAKKSNKMCYPRFTKIIVNFFMTKDQSIPRRNNVNWHFSKDDHMLTTIKLVSRHLNTQQYGAILPIELTNKAIRNSKSIMPLLPELNLPRQKQASGRSKVVLILYGSGADEGTGIIPGVPDVPTYESDDEEISWKSSEDDDEVKISEYDEDVDDQNNDGDNFIHPKFSTNDEEDKDEESFDPVVQTPSQVENTYDKDNDDDSQDVQDIQMVDVQTTLVIKDTHVTLNLVNPEGQQQSSLVSSHFISNMLNPSPDTRLTLFVSQLHSFEAKVLTRSYNSSKSSHAVVGDLSELKPKKILIDKMKSNKSIHKLDEQKNLYKFLVDSYECDKLILDTYGDTFILKRHRDDEDKDEEPSARSNRGSKRRRAGKELESTSAPKKKTSKTSGKSTKGFKSHHKTASESAPAEQPMYTTQDLEEPTHQEFETGATDDQPVEEASQQPH